MTRVYFLTGIVMTFDVARSAGLRVDKDAREMALTYKGLGYGAREAAQFLRTYYLLEHVFA